MFGSFIDWRGYPTVHFAAVKLGLKPLNLVMWAKTNAGMGSLYRSQHELFPLFKMGSAPHVNNVELGKRGRWRSNVWTYPGASSLGSDARRGLEDHPTVKPTAMLEDALSRGFRAMNLLFVTAPKISRRAALSAGAPLTAQENLSSRRLAAFKSPHQFFLVAPSIYNFN